MIKVRKHKGRSGKSVFEWRVYRVTSTGVQGAMVREQQLGKYRSQENAERAAAHYKEQTKEAKQAAENYVPKQEQHT